jgi:hypothetical protein
LKTAHLTTAAKLTLVAKEEFSSEKGKGATASN